MPTPAFNLDIRPSRLWLALLLVSHSLAVIAPWLTSLPAWASCALSLVVLTSAYWQRRQWHGWHSRHLSFGDEGWQLIEDENRQAVIPEGETFISNWLLAIQFRNEDRQLINLVLLPDSADKQQLRRLRMMLRQGIGFTPETNVER